MKLKDFKIGDIVWIKTPWLCNEFGNDTSIIKIDGISDNTCKYSFPIIEHFVRHYTGSETDTFEIDANTEATPQFTQYGFEKEMYKEYDKSQCVYGKDSTMPCMFCSATCQARYEDFTKKGVKIVCMPVKVNISDSNGRVYSKEALENAVKEYNEKKKYEGEMTHKVLFGPYKGTEDGRIVEVDFGEIYNDIFGKEHKITMKFANDWQSLKNDPICQELNDTVSRIYKDRITIDEEIKKEAHWLANKFSAREGYTTTEELLLEMGQFVKNRMLDKYNFKNE